MHPSPRGKCCWVRIDRRSLQQVAAGRAGSVKGRALILAASLALIASLVTALPAAPPPRRNLYLLAGTPTNEGPEGYPVTLYTVGPDREPEPFRKIAGRDEGLYAAWSDPVSGLLYVSYPPGSPTTVSIIHEGDPSAADALEFNPKRFLIVDGSSGLASPSGRQSYALYLVVAPGAPSAGARLVSVEGNPRGKQPRVTTDRWKLYESFRFDGCPGGPAYCLSPRLQLVGGEFLMGAKPNQVDVEKAPPALSKVKRAERYRLVASNPRFFLVSRWYDARELASGAPRTTSVYVRGRASGSWKKIDIPGNRSRSRLFGPWLATIVEDWNPRNELRGEVLFPAGDDNPGLRNERAQPTRRLPSVLMQYGTYEGRENIIRGTLALDELVDGRRISIHTGQEDSEVLDVRADGLVLYRVNDEIFSAQIEGQKIGPARLVVKGEDVPEIHWAFWSKAQAATGHTPTPR